MRTIHCPKRCLALLLAPVVVALAGEAMAGEPVDIRLFRFNPGKIEVAAGTEVVWTNRDAIEHSVTGAAAGGAMSSFDSDFFTQGQSYSTTFDRPGRYEYFCKRHTSMRGVVEVKPTR